MDRFPALRLILRLGRIGPALVAFGCCGLWLWQFWGFVGWVGAFPVLVVTYFLLKSYVELVQIISETVH
jgi:hypothetical protein